MNKDKKSRLLLTGGFILALSAGMALELVKVPVKVEEVSIEKVPAILTSQEYANGVIAYNYFVPEDYNLVYDESGNAYGYKEDKVEVTREVSLGDYIFKKERKSF